MKLSQAIEGFTLQARANLSPPTVTSYAYHLSQLVRFLQNPPLADITSDDISAFFHYFRNDYVTPRGNPYSEASLAKIWATVRAFYNWAVDALEVTRPDLHIPQPKPSPPVIEVLSQGEVDTLINACKQTKPVRRADGSVFKMKRPTHLRDRALIFFLLDTAVRVSECARMCIGDIDLEHPHGARAVVKPFRRSLKSRPRTVFLGKRAAATVWRYMAERDEQFADAPLFLTLAGKPMDRNSIRLLLKRLGSKAGIPRCHPHLFRHTAATQMLLNGMDRGMVKEILGHSTDAMVNRYVHFTEVDLATGFRRASPSDRWLL